jgi:hypothetical protein
MRLAIGLVLTVAWAACAQAQLGDPSVGYPSYAQPLQLSLDGERADLVHNEPGYDSNAPTVANHSLVGAGVALLAVAYGLNNAGTAAWSLGRLFVPEARNGGEYFAFSFVPVVGPFVQLAFSTESWEQVLLTTMGLVQIAGLAMIIVGNVDRSPLTYRWGSGPAAPALSVLPSAAPNGGMLNVQLQF